MNPAHQYERVPFFNDYIFRIEVRECPDLGQLREIKRFNDAARSGGALRAIPAGLKSRMLQKVDDAKALIVS